MRAGGLCHFGDGVDGDWTVRKGDGLLWWGGFRLIT